MMPRLRYQNRPPGLSRSRSIWHGGERIAQEDGRRMTSIGIFGSAGRMGRTIADLLAAEGVALAGGTDAGDAPLPLARAAAALVDLSLPAALDAPRAPPRAARTHSVTRPPGLAGAPHAQ